MSGIATATAQAVALTKGTKASIADTRKTLPGLRALQKYAVTIGGGKNHRFNLSDAAMLKDNHIDAGGGITSAISKLREKVGHMTKIEVETRSLDELREALAAGADIIMLDNMTIEQMAEAGQNHRRQSSAGGFRQYYRRHDSGRSRYRRGHHLHRGPHPFGKGLRHFYENFLMMKND